MKKEDQNQFVRSNDVEWESLSGIDEADVPGVYVKSLLFDHETRRSPTILLKFDAGAQYALHDHPAGEEIYVLEGDLQVGKDRMSAGDYLHTAPGNLHAVRSESGCQVLLKAPEATVFVEKRTAGN